MDIIAAAAERPCANRCIVRGTEDNDQPTLRSARHGAYCDGCYSRVKKALNLAPALAEHVASRIHAKSSGDETRVKTSKVDAPLPFNEQAFHDVNDIYETLAYFARHFASQLHTNPPRPASHAWRNAAGAVKGLPANVTPKAAGLQTATLVMWLEDHLDAIFARPGDDIEYFSDRLGELRAIAGRNQFGEIRPRYSDMPHQHPAGPKETKPCGGIIAIYPPVIEDRQSQIVCERCDTHIHQYEYEADFLRWKRGQLEERRRTNRATAAAARRTRKHLADKYTRETFREKREKELISDALVTALAEAEPHGVLVARGHLTSFVTVIPTDTPGEIHYEVQTVLGQTEAGGIR